MAPDKLILTVISKEDRVREIHRRLQDQETQKARKLLATAMSHFEAMKLVKNQIEENMNPQDKEKKNGSLR